MTKPFYCSFCGKSQHEVQKLIAGPGPFICNECTDMCHDIVHKPADWSPKPPLEPFTPGTFGCHEALHTAHLLHRIAADHLTEHPAIKRHAYWTRLGGEVRAKLFELYEAIRSEHLEPLASAKDEPPMGEVVGFGEAALTQDPHALPIGFAEGVATPDEDVGFVFTPLEPELTGLPVEVWVGDDTPLVIASSEYLGHEAVAAVRHWVVRHRETLTAHWRNQIDSGQLFERLRKRKINI